MKPARLLALTFIIASVAARLGSQSRPDLPRIMVLLDEKIEGQSVDGRLAASAFEELMLEKGFRLIDKDQFAAVTTRDIALAEGNPVRAKEIGARYGAELIIVGKAAALFESEREFYGVKNFEYTAKADAKVIITDTGELIAVGSKSAKKSASGKNSAANLVLKIVGDELAKDLYVKMRLRLNEEKTSARILQIALLGMTEKQIAQLEIQLPIEHTIIKSLRLRFLEKEAAVFEANVNGTIDDLRKALSSDNDLVVIGFTGSRIDVSTKENAERSKGSSVVTSPLEISDFVVENIFPSQVNSYAFGSLAALTVENSSKQEVRNVKASVFIPGFMSLPSEQIIPSVAAGAKQSFKLAATLDAKQLYDLSANTTAQAKVDLSYSVAGRQELRSLVKPVTIYGRNTISWKKGESVGAFVTESDEAVANFARHVIGSLSETEQANLPRPLYYAIAVWDGVRAHGINYVSDPWKSADGDILDVIQYPRETLSSKSGDCDDTSVLLAACLENIGIRTKFLATDDHIFIMFDSEVLPKNGYMISQNENDYVVHEGSVWIPLETTMITKPFVAAWQAGTEGYRTTVAAGGRMEIIDTRKAQAQFPPANLSYGTKPVGQPPVDRMKQFVSQDVNELLGHQAQAAAVSFGALEKDDSPAGKNKRAILKIKAGELDAAIALLAGVATAEAENTLGNAYLLKNELPTSQEHYQKSLALTNADGGIYLNFGIARYLSGSAEDAVEAFQAAISKFDSKERALEILGLDKVQQALGMRGAEKSPRKLSKTELFDLLNKSLQTLPDKSIALSQSQKVREKYKNVQNRYVFGGRRGADPTQIASVKEFLYWKE
jgi:Flp pilus assembly protein TadD